jgi:hypothetical protein
MPKGALAMKITRTLLMSVMIFSFLAALPAAPAPSEDREGLSGTKALDYVRVLTGAEFESRMAGLPGGARASDWIADGFKAWGVEPAGTNGYFQDFKHSVSHVTGASFTIEAENRRRTFAYDEEWRVPPYSGSAMVRGELVYAGYGIFNGEIPWNDFIGLDLKGKIVLMIAYGAPAFLADRVGPEAMPEAKLAKAYELGARAVVFLDEPVDTLTGYQRYPFPAGVMLGPKDHRADLAVAGVNNDAAKAIFRNTGIDLNTRVQQMEKDKKPASTALGITGEIDVRTVYLPEAALRNVLAKITGSDRALRNDIIVIGAHYDGLGMTPDGRLNPGADDNASGTAVVMEIARAMRAGKARPKRTVVFALWDGEEQGLWGSIHYGAHPVFPMDKTVANLNLDMVGNGDGGLQFRGVYYAPEIWEKLKASLPAEILKGVVPTRGGPGGSDHTPFLAGGVPGFFIQTTGAHYGRHDVGDMAGLVDPALLEKAGVFTKAATEVLAGAKDLRPRPDGRERNILRSSTIVDLAPRDAASLIKEAEPVAYPDLDFALVSVAGGSPAEMAKSFFDLTAAVQAAKRIVLYQPPKSDFSIQRFGDRIGVLPGVADLAAFDGQDPVLRMMGRAGLGFVIVRDKDFARGDEEVRRMTAAANAEGVLIIARETGADQTAKLVEWSTRPGLRVGGAPDEEVMKKMAGKRWRLALDWRAGMPAEEYAAAFGKIKEAAAGMELLVGIPGPALQGFSPDLLRLAGLLAPKEMSEAQMMRGGLDELGQDFINLLREVRPPSI